MRGSMAHMVLREIYGAWRNHDLDRLASYLPDDFAHDIVLPPEVTPFAGLCQSKRTVLQRLQNILSDFEVVRFDTSKLLIQGDRAAVQVPLTYWHRDTGTTLESTLGCFWELEEGWPVRLIEYHDVDRISRFRKKLQTNASMA